MSNVIQFPSKVIAKRMSRLKARNVLAALANSTGCNDEISQKLARLIEIMDEKERKIIKLRTKR